MADEVKREVDRNKEKNRKKYLRMFTYFTRTLNSVLGRYETYSDPKIRNMLVLDRVLISMDILLGFVELPFDEEELIVTPEDKVVMEEFKTCVRKIRDEFVNIGEFIQQAELPGEKKV